MIDRLRVLICPYWRTNASRKILVNIFAPAGLPGSPGPGIRCSAVCSDRGILKIFDLIIISPNNQLHTFDSHFDTPADTIDPFVNTDRNSCVFQKIMSLPILLILLIQIILEILLICFDPL